MDGSDPRWQEKHRQYTPDGNALKTANVAGRFRDNGELRYLLRSIEKYWPFKGNIFLVTDQQRPDWLSEDSGVIVIDHTQILSPEYLPTFSSRAIESALHRIPGLAERFVVFNDDIVLGRPVVMSDFFGVCRGVTYVTEEVAPDELDANILAGEQGAVAARAWCRQHLHSDPIRNVLAHTPHGVIKKQLADFEHQHPELFHATRAARFRSMDTHSITTCLYHYFMVAKSASIIMPDPTLYLYSDAVESRDGQRLIMEAQGKALSICVQDVGDDRLDMQGYQQALDAALSELFPAASRFEVDDCD